MMPSDTIFALSSGRGRSGVAVIRVSGPEARLVFSTLAGDLPDPRKAVLRKIQSRSGEIIDVGLALWFQGPHSATGEDLAEFHLHGSPAATERLLRELSDLDGCRAARAGEFSRRAFENQKMDVVELEGLADLLAAESESQRRLAMKQFTGEASSVYEAWRTSLVDALAYVEASIDFTDEHGVEAEAIAHLRPRLSELRAELMGAMARAKSASALRRGLSVVIAGAPNSGKSSLVNALTGRNVSIVSPVSGTTRDVVSESLMIEGVTVRIADTAGLRRDTDDAIERLGMERSHAEIGEADILVWLEAADAAEQVEPVRTPDLTIWSKSDLGDENLIRRRNDWLPVSVKMEKGLEELHARLAQLVRHRTGAAADGTMVRVRHAAAVRLALQHIDLALGAEHGNLEIVAEDMRKAAAALAQITGRVDVEDWLGRIYAEFCIGK